MAQSDRARIAKAKWDSIKKTTQAVSLKAEAGILTPSDIKKLGSAIKMQSDTASALFNATVKSVEKKADSLKPKVIEELKKANAEATEQNIQAITEKVVGLLLQKELPSLMMKMQQTADREINDPLLKAVASDVKEIKKKQVKLESTSKTVGDRLADIAIYSRVQKLKNAPITESTSLKNRNTGQFKSDKLGLLTNNYGALLGLNNKLGNAMARATPQTQVMQQRNALIANAQAQAGVLVRGLRNNYSKSAYKPREFNVASKLVKQALASKWERFVSWRTDIYNKDVDRYNQLHANDEGFKAKQRRQRWYKDDDSPSFRAHLQRKLLNAVSDKANNVVLNATLRYAKMRQDLSTAAYKLRFETWDTIKKGTSKLWNKAKDLTSKVGDLLLDPAALLTVVTGGVGLMNIISGLTGNIDWKAMLYDAFRAIVPAPVFDFFSSVADKIKSIFGDEDVAEEQAPKDPQQLSKWIADRETDYSDSDITGENPNLDSLVERGEKAAAKRRAYDEEQARKEREYQERAAQAKRDAEKAEGWRKASNGVVTLAPSKETSDMPDMYLGGTQELWNKDRRQQIAEQGYKDNFWKAKKAYIDAGWVVPNSILKKQLAEQGKIDPKNPPKGSIPLEDFMGIPFVSLYVMKALLAACKPLI